MHQGASRASCQCVPRTGWGRGFGCSVCGHFPAVLPSNHPKKQRIYWKQGSWHPLGSMARAHTKSPGQALPILCHCFVTVGCGDEWWLSMRSHTSLKRISLRSHLGLGWTVFWWYQPPPRNSMTKDVSHNAEDSFKRRNWTLFIPACSAVIPNLRSLW